MTDPASVPPNISQLTAPLLIGALLNYAFYGILTVQVCIYHIAFPEDAKRFKALVYIVFIVETAQVCIGAADIFYWFAAGYGNMIHLANTHLSSFDDPLLGSISALIAQLFFCYRIWALKKKALWLSIFISCISVVQLGGGISGTVVAYRARTFDKATGNRRDPLMWLVGNVAADLLIASSLTFLLLRERRENQPRTNSILIRIVRLVVETNCLTSAVAVISLVLYLAIPTAPYFVCPTAFLGKLYSNSLLVTMNNRLLFTRHTTQHQGRILSSFQAGTSTGSVVRLQPVHKSNHSRVVSETLHSPEIEAGISPSSNDMKSSSSDKERLSSTPSDAYY